MMTFNQLKVFFALALVCLSLQTNAQTIWSDNMSGGYANWDTIGGSNLGTEQWTWTTNPLAGYQNQGTPGAFMSPTATNGYFMFNSDENGEDKPHVVQLTMKTPVNCTGKNGVRLKFFSEYFYYNAASSAEVGVSTDGTTWKYTKIHTSLQPTINTLNIFRNIFELSLPEANNKPQVWVRFRWTGDYEYHWKIDDVEIFDMPPTMPQVTFRVNMSTQTVNPGGVFLAGSFNNFTNEAMTSAGNGIYTLTKTLTQGVAYSYKFKNGPDGWENSPTLSACGVNDGFGGFNRTYTAGAANETLPAVCFNSCSPCTATPCSTNPNIIFCDNFDSYNTTSSLVTQNPALWGLWPGGGSAPIVTTQAASAPNSILIDTVANPRTDLVLKLGNRSTGRYSLKWKMFIPTGKQGYFNMQDSFPIAANGNGSFVYEVFFGTNGTARVTDAGADLLTFTFPSNAWFTIEQRIDADNNIAEFLINGTSVGSVKYYFVVGGVDFYPNDRTYQYYVDDIEFATLPSVPYTCAQGKVGTYSLSKNNLCLNENLNTILTVDPFSYIIPNQLPDIYGHIWLFTTTPITGTWPTQVAASTQLGRFIGPVGLLNNAANTIRGEFYLTSAVVAGAKRLNPNGNLVAGNLDVSNACIKFGPSLPVTIWPSMTAIGITGTVTNATAPGWNGAINTTITGGSAGLLGNPYSALWSNGKTTKDITGLPPGTYTITVTEPTGCVANATRTFTVGGFVSGVTDPEVISNLSISPNPTSGVANLRLELERSSEVRFELINMLGQVIVSRNLGNTMIVNQEIDLSGYAAGTYILRLTIDEASAMRSIIVNR